MKDEPKKIKLDMTKEEVIEILGEPDSIEELDFGAVMFHNELFFLRIAERGRF